MTFLWVSAFKTYSRNKTDRQTDRQTEAIPNAAHQHVAFVVGKKIYNTDIITF